MPSMHRGDLMGAHSMRLLRALRAMRPQDGGASRILIGTATDGSQFELRKQQLLRTVWGANSRHGHMAICNGFELDAAFDEEVLELLLHGYELDGRLDDDELYVLSEHGAYSTTNLVRDLSLPTWPPQQRREISAARARELFEHDSMLLRAAPPSGVRMLLQLPEGNGVPQLINPGSNRPPWMEIPERWRRSWVDLCKTIITQRAPGSPHLLCDVVLPLAGERIVALDVLGYDWRDVRPVQATERLSLLEQGINELGLGRGLLSCLPRQVRPRGAVSLIAADAAYAGPLFVAAT